MQVCDMCKKPLDEYNICIPCAATLRAERDALKVLVIGLTEEREYMKNAIAELRTQRTQLLTELRERVEAEHTAYVVMYQGAAAHGLTRAIAIIDEYMTTTEPDESEG